MALDPVASPGALLQRDGTEARASAARGGVAQAGAAFEAILLQQVVRAMRATVPDSGLLGPTKGQEVYDHFIETALGEHLAETGVGVAQLFTDEPHIARPAGPGLVRAASEPPSVAGGILASAGPLAGTLPPQDDAWLDSPQVVETLRMSLLTGRSPHRPHEEKPGSGLRDPSDPPVDSIVRDLQPDPLRGRNHQTR